MTVPKGREKKGQYNICNNTACNNNVLNPKLKEDYACFYRCMRVAAYIYKCKNISIKMLKDVGMTVPKSRETRAVYMQQHMG